ncbi:MAG TPA: patatin-like phospholipase family protein [Actinomycetota bacterium]|nr:patatin-like phospholipase family protein [Actinomycetota bacterium]
MSYGLVLGGGGTVGVSWSIGVLHALSDALGFDPARAHIKIGTSAGSVVAAMLRIGKALDDQVAFEREPGPADAADWATSFDISLLAEIFQLWTSTHAMTEEVAREIGARALRASRKTSDEWVGVLRGRLGGIDWPSGDVRMNTVDCATGRRRVWRAGDGADVVRVVAASSAVPGLVPPVEIGPSSFMDGGVWSLLNSDLLSGSGVEDVLILAPQAGAGVLAPGALLHLEREAEALRGDGYRVHSLVPGEGYDVIGANPMDPGMRAPAVELGLREGADWAKSLAEEGFQPQ